jgi:hypothetical protein
MADWAWEDLRGDNATVDLSYTYHMSKYSCVAEFFYIHVFLNYVIYIGGIFCFLTRLIPRLKWMHAFLGRVYISAMALSTVAALLIHNTGLALGVLLAFAWVLSGMIFGWFIIKQHQNQMTTLGLELVDQWLKEDKMAGRSLKVALADAKEQITRAKTWVQRFISYKAAHGILMTLSWFNIAGRFMATGAPEMEFTCYTYPVYKQVNAPIYRTKGDNWASKSLVERLLPLESEKGGAGRNFPGQEWGFFAMLFFFPVISATLFGIVFSKWAAGRERENLKKDQDERGMQLVDAAIGS